MPDPDGMRRRSRAADNYGIGSDALPALTKLVALGSEMTCSVQENTQAGGDQDTDEAQGPADL